MASLQARAFGNKAGDYGMFLLDGHYHVEPRSPAGCLPLVTDPYDITVTNGVATPATHDLHWRPVGSPVTDPVTVATRGDGLPVDIGTAIGDVWVRLLELAYDRPLQVAELPR